MGTNFYVERLGKTCRECGHHDPNATEEIHLGKRSAGWPFLYHADPTWTPESAYENWCALLNTGRIVDEYGQEYTPAQMRYEAAEWDQQARMHELFPGQYVDTAGHRFDPHEFS